MKSKTAEWSNRIVNYIATWYQTIAIIVNQYHPVQATSHANAYTLILSLTHMGNMKETQNNIVGQVKSKNSYS